jgi:hypothetical protein
MKESDQLATSFITPFGMYCYITMPFGLRNAGATYQRCMNHVFGEHIGRTVEAYVDDIIVKMRKASDLLSDLETTFKCLKAKGVKLNPEKCVFGVPRGMLLGFIVSERGIEANPEKIVAITNMGPIKDLKGVQRVMGCLAALSRFISRLGERGLLWGTDIPWVHWEDKRPHEWPKGLISHKVIPSWAWGGTTSEADRHNAGSEQAQTAQ